MRRIAALAGTFVAIGLAAAALLAISASKGSDNAQTSSRGEPECAAGDTACLKELYEIQAGNGDVGAVVSSLLEFPTGSSGCHEAAHVAGRIVGARLPSVALEMNSPTLDAKCDYGYVHGVFQGIADAGKNPVEASKSYCGGIGEKVSRSECFHAAGHGAAIVLDSMDAALGSCEVLAEPDNGSCASGVYMEHVTSYLNQVNRGVEYGPAPISDTRAVEMCSDVVGFTLYHCARKAALFWGPVSEPGSLKTKCENLAARAVDETVALWECGAGLGEWLRNAERWGIPETSEEAAGVDQAIVDSCAGAVDSQDGVLLAGCFEGVIAAILPGQIAGVADQSAWINPCERLEDGEFPVAKRECEILRAEILGSLD